MSPLWEVVGGSDKGGILVRQGRELKSPEADSRLSTGAVVDQVSLVGDRLQYKLREGTGPAEGWISVKAGGKDLAVPKAEKVELQDPASWEALRQAVVDGAPGPSTLKEAGAWLKPEPPTKKVAQAKIRLVIFDWTGNRGGAGAINNFKAWAKVLEDSSPQDTWEVCKVHYPGRAMRLKEDNASRASEVAAAVVEALDRAGPTAGTVLFGFSFGAVLAYETAALLASRGVPLLGLVVASAEHPAWAGRARGQGPSGSATRDMSEASFEDILRQKGGTNMILASPEMKKMYLPVIRADMAMEEGYGARLPELAPLPCPVIAFRGKACPLVAREDVEPWVQCSACGEGSAGRVEELEAGLEPTEQSPWLSDWYICQGDLSSLAIAKTIGQEFGSSG